MPNICAKIVANLDDCDYTTKKTSIKITFLYASDENIGLSLCIYAIFLLKAGFYAKAMQIFFHSYEKSFLWL